MDLETPPKRRPGRPKGTRNKDTAGAVGRPPKDGGPPRKTRRDGSQGDTAAGNSTPAASSILSYFRPVAPTRPPSAGPSSTPDSARCNVGAPGARLEPEQAAALPEAHTPNSVSSSVQSELPVPPRTDAARSECNGTSGTSNAQQSALQPAQCDQDQQRARTRVCDSSDGSLSAEPQLCPVDTRVSGAAQPSGLTMATSTSDSRHGAPTTGTSSASTPAPHRSATTTPSACSNSCTQNRTGFDMDKHGLAPKPYVPGSTGSNWISEEEEGIGCFLGENEDDEDLEHEFCMLPDDDEVEAATLSSQHQPVPLASAPIPPRPKQSRSSMPLWLEDAYREVRDQLDAEIKANASRKPTVYNEGRFVVGGPISYQHAVTKAILTPRDFFNPFFFVWYPHLLSRDGILCPACFKAGRKHPKSNTLNKLHLNGWPSSPRRVVDLEHTVFIVSPRYRCPQCHKSYQGWSPALLDILPPALAMQFTHSLTYRGGLTDRVVSLLRSSFRNGTGPGAFEDMLRSFHHRYFEGLQVQWLEHIRSRRDALEGGLYRDGRTNEPLRYPTLGRFNDRNGFSGFVHGRNYYQAFYNNLLAKIGPAMDQRDSMLGARYLAIDHSHKVSKRLGKVAGESVFGALHTTVNEYGEIRQMTLTPTKAHDQCMPALAKISGSLDTYGHGEVELVFTDNPRGDKAELERIFPYLRHDVHPIEDRTDLKPFTLPDSGWSIVVLASDYQIRMQVNLILEELKLLEGEASELHVGFDMEWPVDRESGVRHRVSVIQIAFKQNILLLHLHHYLRDGFLHLPPILLTFLRSSRIRKIGVGVKGDLTRLYDDCNMSLPNDTPFSGALDLGALAKSKNITPRANPSLVDLTARTLHRRLAKPESIRVGLGWKNATLSQDHIHYAALDVYACCRIFEVLNASPDVGQDITEDSREGTAVDLMARDGSQVVARGHLLSERPKQLNGVNVSKTRVVVRVSRILVPGYIIPSDLVQDNEPITMRTFAQRFTLPTTLLWKFKQLRMSAASEELSDTTGPVASSNSHSDHSIFSATEQLPVPAAVPPSYASSSSDLRTPSEPSDDVNHWYEATELDPSTEQGVELSEADPPSHARAAQLLQYVESHPCDGLHVIRSRVLGDIWHLMDQFKISVHHGLRRPFARALRDALFIPDSEDKAAIEEVLRKRGVSFDAVLLSHPEWILSRMKRVVPQPDILIPRVVKVLTTFGPLKDATTGQPLFNDAAWDTCDNVVENLRRGYFTDPPGLPLYYVRGKDRDGLNLYRSLRGTNHVEGGVHQNVIRNFSAFNASPQFANNLLRDYRFVHNLQVGTFNRTGQRWQGSYDVLILNRISFLESLLEDVMTYPPGSRRDWVNGWDYEPTKETFGILPIADATKAAYGMLSYDPAVSAEPGTRHQWLANAQSTRHAILPVHTAEERALFRLLASETNGIFAGKRNPNWVAVAARWSGSCNGKTIFYKLPEHLKNYYKSWTENRNEQNSVEECREAYQRLRSSLAREIKDLPAIPSRHPTSLASEICPPNAPPAVEVTSWDVSNPSTAAATSGRIKRPYSDVAANPMSIASGSTPVASGSAPVIKKRKARCCVHCGRPDCNGKFNSRPCQFPKCSKCARTDCNGVHINKACQHLRCDQCGRNDCAGRNVEARCQHVRGLTVQ